MDPVKLDEIRKKRRAELTAELKEIDAELKKLKEERSLPGAKVKKLENFSPFLVEVSKKHRAALREAYSNLEPPILRLNSAAASPPGVIMLPA